jgi:hypothetical protein
MATPSAARNALRANTIAGLLEYKPGPGIYSRLERAVQQLPENVRVQELPGLLKRYKDGIPGWELNAVDLDSVVAGRAVVPRDELLAVVRERSPVYTTREVRLSEYARPAPPVVRRAPDDIRLPALDAMDRVNNLGFDTPMEALAAARAYPDWRQRWEMTDAEAEPVKRYLEYFREQERLRAAPQAEIGGIGAETPHGVTRFQNYKPADAENYTELVYLQPNAAPEGAAPPVSWMPDAQHHWHTSYPMPWGAAQDVQNATTRDAVAHMRFAEHGDALRLLESQSDLHNRNIKAAKAGEPIRPYAMEPVQTELDAKRLLLEAARQGKSAVEIASPEYVSENVGMPMEHAQHRYGKVLPSEMERAGRKLGGFSAVERPATEIASGAVSLPTDRWRVLGQNASDAASKLQESGRLIRELAERSAVAGIGDAALPEVRWDTQQRLSEAIRLAGIHNSGRYLTQQRADALRNAVAGYIGDRLRGGVSVNDAFSKADQAMPEIMRHVEHMQEMSEAYESLAKQSNDAYDSTTRPPPPPPGWRGVISDEMRRRIINEGIPAAVAIGVGTGLATGSNEAQAAPRLPLSEDVFRSAMPWQTQRKIGRLTKQVDSAYEKGDFKTAEKLDAQREQLVDDWDNKLDALDEGDGNADFEPENYEYEARNYTEDLIQTYGAYLAGRIEEEDLPNALRGAFADKAIPRNADDVYDGFEQDSFGRAKAIPDADIIAEAKAAFEQRQAHLAKVRSRSPEDGVRAMQAQLRGAGLAPAVAAGSFTGKPDNGVPFGEFLLTKPAGGEEQPSRGFDFSMAISPGEWDAYYEQQAASGPSQDALDFRKNVAEVMQQPIIRVGAANDGNLYGGPGLLVDGEASDRITPAQFVNEYLDRFSARMPAEGRAQVLQAVQAKLDGSTRASDEMTDDIVGRMMTSLKASSPQGQYAKTDPMPQEQLDQLKAQHGDWAESMLTPGTAENFDSLRGYELLRTTLDGEHAPVYADSLSNAAAFVGGVVDPRSRQNFADATLRSGPEGRFSRANRDYFGSRQRPDEPAAFRNQDGSSRFAATSASNIQGLMRAGGDMSTTIGKLSWPLYESFSEFGRTPVGKAVTGEGLGALWNGSDDSNFMAARRNAFDREQPIQPAGMSREEFDRQQASHKQDRAQGEAWGATTWPNVQNAIEQSGLMFSPRAWGGAPQPAQPLQKTWGPPAYNNYGPNFLQNTVGNIPSAGIMVGAAATGGLGGLAAGAFKPSGSTVRTLINAGMGLGKGAAKGVGTAVASQAADLPADTATDLGIGSTLAGPQNYINFLTTPESENALLPGVDPNAISIDELNQRRSSAMDDREKKFRSDMWDWNKRPKNQYESAYEQWQRGQ